MDMIFLANSILFRIGDTVFFLLGSMYLFMVQRHWQGTSRLTFGKITEIIQFILLSIDTKIEMPKKRSKILITRNVITGT